MNLLALSGSSSSTSINRMLLQSALTLLPPEVSVQQVSVIDLQAPMYSADLERSSGAPGSIAKLHRDINAADALLLASPEHNGSMPAMLKNTIDWLSRVHPGKGFLNTRLALISTSPGQRAGAGNINHIASFAPFWGATVVGTFSLPSFGEAFDTNTSSLKSSDHRESLSALLTQLITP